MALLRIMASARVEVFIPEGKKPGPDGNYEGRWQATTPDKLKKDDLFRWQDWNQMRQQRALSVQKQAEHVHVGFDDAHAETKRWGV